MHVNIMIPDSIILGDHLGSVDLKWAFAVRACWEVCARNIALGYHRPKALFSWLPIIGCSVVSILMARKDAACPF